MKLKRKWLLCLTFTVVVGCGGADDDDLNPGGDLGLGSPRSGDVGQGYDSLNRTIKPMYCIQPAAGSKWAEVGIPVSSLSMTLQGDRTKVAQSMGLEVEASYGITSAAASFFRETETDDFSVAYIFGGTMQFKSVQVGPSYEVTQQMAEMGVVEWHRLCGDSYIHSVTRGAALYSGLKFHFSSRTDKQSFESRFKVAGGLSVSAALKQAQQVSTQGVQVSVTAVQVGGDVAELSRALDKADSAPCSLGDIKSCLGYLEALERYASTTFPKEFKDTSGRPLTGAELDAKTATVGYEIDFWPSLAIPNLPDLSGKPQAMQLLSLYSTQFSNQSRIDAIKGMPIIPRRKKPMADEQRRVLDAESLKVARNVGALDQAWVACYPTVTAACTAAIEATITGLEAIDPENLEPWFDMMYADGRDGDKRDLVDLRGDGHKDLCLDRVEYTIIPCLMGVGKGFEEKPSKFLDHKEKLVVRKPYAWMKLGGTKFDLAYCAPPKPTDPTLHCIPLVDGELKGTILFLKSGGVVTIRSSLDTSGIDGNKVFQAASTAINGRWNNTWTGGR